ncbi:MAG: Holliday junction branch migration DNA helicase RuvB [Patescibacteria group bacterium]
MSTSPLAENTDALEEQLLVSLRAAAWDEFAGQELIKESLQIAIQAAQGRKETLDHTLLYGPPGLGKTTLSHLISKEMGGQLKITSGTALTKVADLAAIITNIQEGDVLFIDEVHRLPKPIEETLYPVMEDFALDIIIGKGPSARTVRLDLPRFTLVAATTRYGLLASPFRDRFGLVHRLEYYQPDILQSIIMQAAQKLSLQLPESSAIEIAQRSRGTPRIALKLLKRVRDYTEVKQQKNIQTADVQQALDMIAIDQAGLEETDRKLLQAIITKHNGGPVGLSTLAAMLNEDSLTVEEVLEPYLLQIGFLKRTPKGRMATNLAYQHLGHDHFERDSNVS